MCMMCEEEAMYQAYLEYLARKAAEQDGGKPTLAAPAGGFACDPAPAELTADAPARRPSAMPKAS
jgi:hypothetical protein